MATTTHSAASRRFRPYVYIETTERYPSFLPGSAATALAEKYLEIPDAVLTEPLSRQLRFVQRLTRAHWQEQHGACSSFGAITGFIFRWSEEESIALGTDGTVRDPAHGRFAEDGKTLVYLNGTPMEAVLVRV
ncbi:MAG: hypothetical protein BWY76_03008 [bacterium ADurb.Bin429]|nr:MAG: hypothetical protein BWY76_03008 [bacterium ADurb.Bin429]